MKWTKPEEKVLLQLGKKAYRMAERGSLAADVPRLPDGTWGYIAWHVKDECGYKRSAAACRSHFKQLTEKS